MSNAADMRREYSQTDLDITGTAPDPFAQFGRWFDEAVAAGLPEVNAMTLATADRAGRPSARIVLLKGFSPAGFVFYTDYRSRKGIELDQNPRAALVFHWGGLERQVRATGPVERLDPVTSFAYFRTRPEGSRIGAWASRQSRPIADRDELEREYAQQSAEFVGKEIPLPPHWGGFVVVADEVEFWQGRPSRLHDRIQYLRDADGSWRRARLSP